MFNQILTPPLYIYNKQLVFISDNSFKQREEIAINIRKYIDNIIKHDNITTIGGEAYLIGLTNNKVKKNHKLYPVCYASRGHTNVETAKPFNRHAGWKW